MGGYGSIGVLMLAGWTFLSPVISWVYFAALVAFELWLLRRIAAAGRGPAPVGEPPYRFSDEEAELVGRYRFYFTYPEVARQSSSVFAAIGLTGLVLVPWLTYKLELVQAVLIGLNLFAVARFTKTLAPVLALRARANRGDRAALRMLELHDPLWSKIRDANAAGK